MMREPLTAPTPCCINPLSKVTLPTQISYARNEQENLLEVHTVRCRSGISFVSFHNFQVYSSVFVNNLKKFFLPLIDPKFPVMQKVGN